MRERRNEDGDGVTSGIDRDLAALRESTRQDIADLSTVARAVRNRNSDTRGGSVMAFARKHPFLTPALMTTAVLITVLFLPLSFDRTVAHDVSLTLQGPALDPNAVAALAKEIQAQLGAEQLAVNATAENGAAAFTMTASAPSGGGAKARRVVDAFEKALEQKGLTVTASVTPRVERVSGTVAAYAADRVIRIETEGKSAGQIESEIRTAMQQAGFGDVQVSVSDEGAGKHRIEVRAERDAQGAPPEEVPQIIVGDENANDADRVMVQMRKIKDDAGVTSLKLNLGVHGQETEVVVPNVDTMSDSALESEIERQLSMAGIQLDVTVQDGKVNVETP